MGRTVLTLLSGSATTHSTAAAIIRDAGLSGMAMISSPTTLTVPGKALARSRLIRILRIAGPPRATSCHLHSLTPLRPKLLTLLHATPTGACPSLRPACWRDAMYLPKSVAQERVLLVVRQFMRAYEEACARISGHQKNQKEKQA
jgi:hypothetical protein